ncbi:hypothetical protein RIF23_05300 [Lipingzhangella sp. LS1_29]|uniref:Ig-like domain-containing protein n=1 Tax=Lipingzhangella rawalii TaxID=2055835 RepID=A0ABU2H329_9ACTN|nr:hypothetical protein [Lipingzhangella rawalii]MDS1269706.1 hypothetical protein [Lipingzhangella rawalii]
MRDHGRTLSPTRIPGIAAAAASACGVLVLAAAPAHADSGSTTVEPAGHHLHAVQVGNGSFETDAPEVSCAVSESQRSASDPVEVNQIPEAPDNHNPDGSVGGELSAPVFSDCDVDMFLVGADVTTTPGTWNIEAQHGEDPTITLTVAEHGEPGGIHVDVTGLTTCDLQVAPGGPVDIEGEWIPGDPGVLVFDEAPIPINETTGNFGCPTSDEALFSAEYEIHNETDPSQPVTITD